MHSRIYSVSAVSDGEDNRYAVTEDEAFEELQGHGIDYCDEIEDEDEELEGYNPFLVFGTYDAKKKVFIPDGGKMKTVMKGYWDEFEKTCPKSLEEFASDSLDGYRMQASYSDTLGLWFHLEGWGYLTEQEFLRHCLSESADTKGYYLNGILDYHY